MLNVFFFNDTGITERDRRGGQDARGVAGRRVVVKIEYTRNDG